MEVAPTTVTPVADTPPTFTVAPVAKFVPVIVTDVPPAIWPVVGAMLATVGAGSGGASTRVDANFRFAPSREKTERLPSNATGFVPAPKSAGRENSPPALLSM
jgi:hypothetical protein